MANTNRELILNKEQECFIYRHNAGDEAIVLDVIMEQWENPEINIDELDVIMMMLKLKESLIVEANQFLEKYWEAN